MDEQIKLAHKVVEVVDSANKNIFATLLWYSVEKTEFFFAQVRLIVSKMEDEKFQQIVYVKNKPDEFIYLFDVMTSVYNKFITNQPVCNVL